MGQPSRSLAQRPQGLLRFLARLPIWLYRARLGWLLGNRFLMLTHIGRNSGLPRHAVVEVVRHDKTTDTYFIVSGFGKKSDWLRNICKTPNVTVYVSTRRLACVARRISQDEAVREFKDYALRHPAAVRVLSRVLGYPWDKTEASYQELARLLPIVALRS
jgi:deazaflavin-dependent oxidoreductase (nitroreductase family)